MKKLFALSLAALLLVPAVSPAAIVITEAMSSEGAGQTYGADWFEIYNNGLSPVSLAGYMMDDNSFNIAVAVPLTGVATLNPGQAAVFVESADPTTTIAAFKSSWFGASVPAGFLIGTYTGSGVSLGSGGDGVVIFDGGGTELNRVSFGAATAGTSFGYNSATSTFGALSTSGAFGAFTAPSGEIGSPGAVPEPSTWAMLVAGVMSVVFLARRRRLIRA